MFEQNVLNQSANPMSTYHFCRKDHFTHSQKELSNGNYGQFGRLISAIDTKITGAASVDKLYL